MRVRVCSVCAKCWPCVRNARRDRGGVCQHSQHFGIADLVEFLVEGADTKADGGGFGRDHLKRQTLKFGDSFGRGDGHGEHQTRHATLA